MNTEKKNYIYIYSEVRLPASVCVLLYSLLYSFGALCMYGRYANGCGLCNARGERKRKTLEKKSCYYIYIYVYMHMILYDIMCPAVTSPAPGGSFLVFKKKKMSRVCCRHCKVDNREAGWAHNGYI